MKQTTVFLGRSFSATSCFFLIQYFGISKTESVVPDNSLTFQDEILVEVNRFRTLHSVPSLALDNQLSKDALKWALLLHKKGKKDGNMKTWYAHPKNQGECVYTEANSRDSGNMTGHIYKAVIEWYCEMRNFNFSENRYRDDTAQFSQMVWKETKRVGFANAVNIENGDVAIVARFAPMGNWHYLEAFNKNIHEPTKETKECPWKKKEHQVETTTTTMEMEALGRGLFQGSAQTESQKVVEMTTSKPTAVITAKLTTAKPQPKPKKKAGMAEHKKIKTAKGDDDK